MIYIYIRKDIYKCWWNLIRFEVCIDINFLGLILCYGYVRCCYWGKLGKGIGGFFVLLLYILSYFKLLELF